jgi:hypothetical protein
MQQDIKLTLDWLRSYGATLFPQKKYWPALTHVLAWPYL